jgi:hypothetical protein
LDRLLNSIAIQNFRNFEVVVTDDSRMIQKALCNQYQSRFSLSYHHNAFPEPQLESSHCQQAVNGSSLCMMMIGSLITTHCNTLPTQYLEILFFFHFLCV